MSLILDLGCLWLFVALSLIFEMVNRYIAQGDLAMFEPFVTVLWLVRQVSVFNLSIYLLDGSAPMILSTIFFTGRTMSLMPKRSVIQCLYIHLIFFRTYFLACIDFTQ